MHSMKSFGVILLIFCALLVVFVGFQIFLFLSRERDLQAQLSAVQSKFESANDDRDRLRAELEYFSRPENLEKELRLRFNYRKIDEKMIIVVPTSTSSTTQATSS